MKATPPIFNLLTPAEIMVEPFIDKNEVAIRLNRTVRAVEKMMKARQIPFYKFDAHAAFRWSEIQSALAESSRFSHQTINPN